VGTEDAPVLDHLAPLRHSHDSGAGYKYPYLLTYFVKQTAIQNNKTKNFQDGT